MHMYNAYVYVYSMHMYNAYVYVYSMHMYNAYIYVYSMHMYNAYQCWLFFLEKSVSIRAGNHLRF